MALIVGVGSAGLLVAGSPSGWALSLTPSFAVAALFFGRIRVPAQPLRVLARVLGDVRAGFREVLSHTWLFLLIGQALVFHLFYGAAQGVLGPDLAEAQGCGGLASASTSRGGGSAVELVAALGAPPCAVAQRDVHLAGLDEVFEIAPGAYA